MTLLLDTHVFLWWREDSPRVKSEAREAIVHADLVFVSAASAWEAAIKSALGKLRIPAPFERGVEESEFHKLSIEFQHAAAVAELPSHHSDPFDRMLIAQAQVENLTLVTHDAAFEPYTTEILWT